MKRILTIISVLTLVMASGAVAEEYGWSISNSSTDAFSNTGVPVPALSDLYLWFVCAAGTGDNRGRQAGDGHAACR